MRRRKKAGFELPLTPLIDIFSILVIFLITGTYFAPASISLPKDLDLPGSQNSEMLEVATQIHVSRSKVMIPEINYTIPLSVFRRGGGARIAEFQTRLSDLISKLPGSMKQNGVTINLLADKDIRYSTIFNIVQAAKVQSVDNVLFIAAGD